MEDIFLKGRHVLRSKEQEQRSSRPTDKDAPLRGGSSGFIEWDKNGAAVIYGKCHRLSHLRQMGIEAPVEEYVLEMFDEGLSNEDTLSELLVAGLGENVPVLYEEDFPVSHTTPEGTGITGRCDVVIGTPLSPTQEQDVAEFVNAKLGWAKAMEESLQGGGQAGKLAFLRHYVRSLAAQELGLFTPTKGLEIKKKLTYKGVVNVHYNLQPDNAHLIQAAFYSAAMGQLPFSLVYRWGSMWNLDSEMRVAEVERAMQQHGVTKNIRYRDWATKLLAKGTPSHITPGRRVFELEWENDRLVYHTEETKIETLITMQGIEEYYDIVKDIRSSGNLGPRPTARHVGIGVGATYRPCGLCELKDVCDKYEDGEYSEWLFRVKKKMAELNGI